MIGQLLLCVSGIAVVLFLGGTALARRVGWPLFIPGILALCTSMVVGGSVVLLADLYFSRRRPNGLSPNAIPWIENLGISLIVAAVAFFLASLCLFFAACIPSVRQGFGAKSGSHDA
jgi:hypothetical protein